jgi:hypothetical protein
MLYIDNIAVKGLKSNYKLEILPSVQRFVKEHIVNIDKTL